MQNRQKLQPALLAFALALSSAADAAAATSQESPGFDWYAEAGLGYDSNAFLAPRETYVDYALGATQNQTVVPQAKSGYFVPYKVRVKAGEERGENGRMLGLATLSGRKYLGSLGDADEFNLEGKGGMAFELGNDGKSNKEVYGGLVLEKHDQVYVDHDSGASKTTAGGSNISNRYNYTALGVEGEFKDDLGAIDYSIKGQFLQNDYDDPVVVSQLDHNYTSIGGDFDYLLKEGTKLNFTAARSIRDYSARHARSANGVYTAANPLLKYTYNDLGASLRDRISQEWLYYIVYDYSQRADGYVNYNDYKSHRFGGRVLFEQGQLKGRLALNHWKRDYPNAFAYDIAGQPRKKYSGNDLRVKGEFAQTRQLSYWAEVVIDTQDSSDKRYAYDRKQLMAGARWDM